MSRTRRDRTRIVDLFIPVLGQEDNIEVDIRAMIWTAALLLASPPTLDADLSKLFKEARVAGLSTAVSRNARTVYKRSFGYADLEHQVKMTENSVHELASVSKAFTATSILILEQRGKLKLSDPISKFFPGCPEAWGKITVEHLLNHTGGLGDYLGLLNKGFGGEYSRKEIEQLACQAKPEFDPGTKWSYSNTGYALLGFIVETASGKSLAEFTQKELIEPLGLKSTFFNDSRTVVRNRAEGYVRNGSSFLKEDFTSRSLSGTGDGHILSSAADMLLWLESFAASKLLNSDSRKKMFRACPQSVKELAGTKVGYGYGWSTASRSGVAWFTHSGGWMGTNTFVGRYPDKGVCVVMLCNTEGFSAAPKFIQRLEEEFLR